MTTVERPVILIADDDSKIVYAFRETFKASAEVISAANGEEAIDQLKAAKPSVAFVDITMPKQDGLSVLKAVTALEISTPIIIITGYGTMTTAIDAMKLGAFDYITKPLDIEKVRSLAQRAMEVAQLRSEVTKLKSALAQQPRDNEMVGSHPTMQEIYKQIGMIVQTPNATNVLITGESGTGKELAARAIHNSGASADKPFIPINCTALPENLLETELFGHEKGAFTGAHKTKIGKFELAAGGTIFLDEIGDMPLSFQMKLLRVLESREFTPLGGHRLVPIQSRFITATNRDLETLLEANKFRRDLYYRLKVLSINVPPLRDRKDDIHALVHFFISRHSRVHGKQISAIADDALAVLMAYNYPGNVRELQNILISATTQEQSENLTLASLPPYLLREVDDPSDLVPQMSYNLKEARQQSSNMFEVSYLRRLLRLTGGNVTQAAERAGITRQSLQRMMRSHGIQSNEFRH